MVNQDSQSDQLNLISSLIHSEYEISSCLHACRLAQKRALNLINDIKSKEDLSNNANLRHYVQMVLNKLTLESSSDGKENIVEPLPIIRSTIRSVRARLERRMSRVETSDLREISNFPPRKGRQSQAVKHAVKTRALLEKLNYFRDKMELHRDAVTKFDLMLNCCDEDSQIKDVDLLLEERLKSEMDIQILSEKMGEIKKSLTKQYQHEYGQAQHRTTSEEVSISDAEHHDSDQDQMIKSREFNANHTSHPNMRRKRKQSSIAVQTCSAMTGFRSDAQSQTMKSAFKMVTLCTQTQRMLHVNPPRSSAAGNSSRKASVTAPKEELWSRRDLELPIPTSPYQKAKKNGKNRNVRVKGKYAMESRGQNNKPLKGLRRFMTRWNLNMDNQPHIVVIQYTSVPSQPPTVNIDGRNVDFENARKVFRRIFDGKNWRIFLQICNAGICIRSTNGLTYKMTVRGVPFEQLKKTVVKKQWT